MISINYLFEILKEELGPKYNIDFKEYMKQKSKESTPIKSNLIKQSNESKNPK